VWASKGERVAGRGVVDVLTKAGVELKYPLSIQIPYFRPSGTTISNKSHMFGMMQVYIIQIIATSLLYCIDSIRAEMLLIVIPPRISTVSHPPCRDGG
jgi:hypothetical protein